MRLKVKESQTYECSVRVALFSCTLCTLTKTQMFWIISCTLLKKEWRISSFCPGMVDKICPSASVMTKFSPMFVVDPYVVMDTYFQVQSQRKPNLAFLPLNESNAWNSFWISPCRYCTTIKGIKSINELIYQFVKQIILNACSTRFKYKFHSVIF